MCLCIVGMCRVLCVSCVLVCVGVRCFALLCFGCAYICLFVIVCIGVCWYVLAFVDVIQGV